MQKTESAADWGDLTSKFGIGVMIHKDPRARKRYFVLMEDFTCNGQTNFRPGAMGEETGTLDGKIIHYDFDESNHGFSELKFMHDEAMIHLNKE